MAKTSMKQLEALQTALVNALTSAVGKQYFDPESGEEIPPPAAILNVARQLLKDNGVQAEAVQGSPLSFLQAGVLPFAELKEEYEERRKAG